MTGRAEGRFQTDIAQYRILLLLDALDGPSRSTAELAALVNLSRPTVLPYVRYLRDCGIVYLRRWRDDGGGHWSPLWALGKRPDAPMPPAKSNAENCRRYHRRMRQDPNFLWQESLRGRASRIRPRADPLVAALFGRDRMAA